MRLVTQRPPDAGERQKVNRNQLRFKLASLIKTSELMLEHASNRNWEILEKLEVRRCAELEELDALEENDATSVETAAAYTTLLEINKKISELVKSEKEILVNDYQSKRKTASAALKYNSN